MESDASMNDPIGELRDGSDLPELLEGDMNSADLASLQRDLSQFTQIESVVPRIRGGLPGQPPPTIALDAAFDGLLDGSLAGVQIRYRYDGQNFCDTLMPTPTGARLVRMADIIPR